APYNITQQPGGAGTTGPGVAGYGGWVRYYWRKDMADARWAWYLTHLGFPNERITPPGHDPGSMQIVMDSSGNLHGVILDFYAANAPNYYSYVYAYKPNDEPPPNGPRGKIAGTVRDQFGVPVANAAVNADFAA